MRFCKRFDTRGLRTTTNKNGSDVTKHTTKRPLLAVCHFDGGDTAVDLIGHMVYNVFFLHLINISPRENLQDFSQQAD